MCKLKAVISSVKHINSEFSVVNVTVLYNNLNQSDTVSDPDSELRPYEWYVLRDKVRVCLNQLQMLIGKFYGMGCFKEVKLIGEYITEYECFRALAIDNI
jgi:hypothetical protein